MIDPASQGIVPVGGQRSRDLSALAFGNRASSHENGTMDFASDPLMWLDQPRLEGATMLLAFTGWMDGGDVSTGTVQRLVDKLDARTIAHIDAESFYIFNFPGGMEITALFRPEVRIEDGLIRSLEMPENNFSCADERGLVFFVGKEPNLGWRTFGHCIFDVAETIGVKRILFTGSYAGTVPHTREPRLYSTVSEPALKDELLRNGVRPADYEGPASFTTYLMTQAGRHGLEMATLVAEIPAYIQGVNPACIEAVTRRLAKILGLPADLAELRNASDEWEGQVNDVIGNDEELADRIRQLEADYDQDLLEFQDQIDDG